MASLAILVHSTPVVLRYTIMFYDEFPGRELQAIFHSIFTKLNMQ